MPQTIACLGYPHFLGVAINWMIFDTALSSGRRCARPGSASPAVRHEGRALPLLQLVYDRDRLLATKSRQN